MHADRGWLEEDITLGQFISRVREGSAVEDESSVCNQYQGDKVHKTLRRLLFVTGAARDEQMGEHKTFFKASRWVNSRAVNGRGWTCWVQVCASTGKSRMAPPTTTRPRCPLTTRHSAKTEWEQMRDRVSCALARVETTLTELWRERAPEAEIDHLTRMTTETTIQSGRVHDRGKPSRSKPDERCRTFAVQTFKAKTPTMRRSQRRAKVDHTWHSGIHDHADHKVANRALGWTKKTRLRDVTRIQNEDSDKMRSRFKMSVGMGVMNCADNTDDKNLAIMTVKGIGITATRLDVMCRKKVMSVVVIC